MLKVLKIEEDRSVKSVARNLITRATGGGGVKGAFEIKWNMSKEELDDKGCRLTQYCRHIKSSSHQYFGPQQQKQCLRKEV